MNPQNVKPCLTFFALLFLSCGPAFCQITGQRPLNLSLPADVLHERTRPTERTPLPPTPEIHLYLSQAAEKMHTTISNRLRANKQLCGEMDILVLINADGSIRDVQFPEKASGNHYDPNGMLESAFRQVLAESPPFAPVPEALRRDPKFVSIHLNRHYSRRCPNSN